MKMFIPAFDRWLASNLPTEFLKDFYPRAMRRLTELGLLGGTTTRETKHGFRMSVDRLDAVKWYVHYFGEFEPCISGAFKAVLPKGGTVVDIGGNIGYHAILSAVAVGPQGKVITFEPASVTYAQLAANIALNGLTNVQIVKAAVSDHSGTADLYFAGNNELGSSSLFDRGIGRTKETVSLLSFRDIAEMVELASIDLIKIDVEGAEASVIRGMIDHIGKLKRECVIFLEIADEDVSLIEPFLINGFEYREITNLYTTSFYRKMTGERRKGSVMDLVLCRDCDILSKAMTGSNL